MKMDKKPEFGEDANWQIWYQDTFDRDCPRRIEVEGEGLLVGLIALWKRHLFETVQEAGWVGFSHFDLWWEQEKTSIRVVGNWDGQVQLRRWVYPKGVEPKREPYEERADEGLLRSIAKVHRIKILHGETSEAIVKLASETERCDDFKNLLKHLLR
jgi:hypothetical protein